jgi:hypothetical protein
MDRVEERLGVSTDNVRVREADELSVGYVAVGLAVGGTVRVAVADALPVLIDGVFDTVPNEPDRDTVWLPDTVPPDRDAVADGDAVVDTVAEVVPALPEAENVCLERVGVPGLPDLVAPDLVVDKVGCVAVSVLLESETVCRVRLIDTVP